MKTKQRIHLADDIVLESCGAGKWQVRYLCGQKMSWEWSDTFVARTSAQATERARPHIGKLIGDSSERWDKVATEAQRNASNASIRAARIRAGTSEGWE